MAASPEVTEANEKPVTDVTVANQSDGDSENDGKIAVPMSMKIVSVILVSLIGFGGHWSSGVTGALKSTLKKELDINNKQYALLDSSQDFIKLTLILLTGVLTDRYGGARTMFWGNLVFSAGSILIAAATSIRNYRFMIFGIIVQALGDVSTQVAQYKIFSSWFPPSSGFASTLAFELGLGKIGSFVGTSTANIIAKNMGDFSWAYWMAVVMNVFTNIATAFFFWFTRWCQKRYSGVNDPATGEKLTENNKKLEISKALRLPWNFWLVCLFSLFQTTTASVFSSNGTELAEQRFDVSAIDAGWYSAASQYLGFFFVPLVGIFIDILGRRVTVMCVCGSGMLIAMCLAMWGPTVSGTAASFGVYAVAYSLGPTVIIDSIRTSMWFQEVFGTGYAIKIAINNAMSIIVSIVCGVIQDRDDGSYDNVIAVYVTLAAGSVVVSYFMLFLAYKTDVMAHLQWSRKKRVRNGERINEVKKIYEGDGQMDWKRKWSLVNICALIMLILGAWAAYFWGVATGKNY